MKLLQFLFETRDRVSRKAYVCWGAGLMVLKYLGEALLYLFASEGKFFSVQRFLSPILSYRYPDLSIMAGWFLPLIILWSLPFIWIGVGMTIRRSADANLSPWLGIVFFVPALNYLLMFILSVIPSSTHSKWGKNSIQEHAAKVMSPFLQVIAFSFVGTLLIWCNTNFLEAYGTSLFIGSPLILGLVQGYWINRTQDLGESLTIQRVALTVFLIHLLLLLFALEGIICMVMSLPICLVLAILGAVFGCGIARHTASSSMMPLLLIFLLPLLGFAEKKMRKVHKDVVLSTVIIDALPIDIWPHLVKFSELPPAEDWIFKLGVAHPIRARIEGHGVGATRYCEFTTGAFVEPITHWEEPTRLAFDVTSQPHPLKEISFYDKVQAPHLDGYFRSVNGEFRLISMPNGLTRLEGRTWYEMDLHPGWYWQIYGRWIIHKIHLRVLEHIKQLSEKPASGFAAEPRSSQQPS